MTSLTHELIASVSKVKKSVSGHVFSSLYFIYNCFCSPHYTLPILKHYTHPPTNSLVSQITSHKPSHIMSTDVKTTRAWRIQGNDGFHNLKYIESDTVPQLGDHDVLVKLHAASLNYRDLSILQGTYPLAQRPNVVPGSDGAGEVLAVGPRVSRFQKGDKVMTLFNQTHLAGSLTETTKKSGLGGVHDGTLRGHGVFEESGLVAMPSSLSYREAATLPCAALTAWNALYGLAPGLRPGQVVLTQGTGGVSLFAVQFAKAAGAIVIATTSSQEKADKLKALGADHIINYRETPNWGEKARELSGANEGVDFILEVGGPKTLAQSLKACKIDGVITIIGYLAEGEKDTETPNWLECLARTVTVRGVLVGSRHMFEEMNAGIEANKVKPVVDEKVWKLEELREAYQFMWDQKHFGKVVIDLQ
jgi:NADPH:quinone reductase-like Zn-dependent oxidoreductase